MSVDPNAPAHPCRPSDKWKGLTIRQAYAMAAMQGLLADHKTILAVAKSEKKHGDKDFSSYALTAFDVADQMIAHENGEASQ